MQDEFTALCGNVGAIAFHTTLNRLAALLEAGRKVPLQEAKPVAIGDDLVLGIDGCDGVLAVHDRRDGRLQNHVGDTGRIGLADRVLAIDDDLDVQPVATKQDRRRLLRASPEAHELPAIGKFHLAAGRGRDDQRAITHGKSGRIAPGPVEGHALVEKLAREGHDLRSARGVVAARLRHAAHCVGAIERIVERPPAGVGRVESIAGVGDGNHELGAREFADLGVDIAGRHGEGTVFLDQIPDLLEERLVGAEIDRPRVGPVPIVDTGLKIIAAGEQLAIAGREIAQDRGQSLPEALRRHSGSRQGLLGHERGEFPVNLQSGKIDTFHDPACSLGSCPALRPGAAALSPPASRTGHSSWRHIRKTRLPGQLFTNGKDLIRHGNNHPSKLLPLHPARQLDIG